MIYNLNSLSFTRNLLKVKNNETSILISTEEDGLLTPYRLQKSEYAIEYWKSLGNGSGTNVMIFSLLIVSMIFY